MVNLLIITSIVLCNCVKQFLRCITAYSSGRTSGNSSDPPSCFPIVAYRRFLLCFIIGNVITANALPTYTPSTAPTYASVASSFSVGSSTTWSNALGYALSIGSSGQPYMSVSSAGDVNHDTVDDYVISSWQATANSFSGAGITYVLFGSNTDSEAVDLSTFTSGTSGFRLLGSSTNMYSGQSLSALGDINGDGMDDIIIGAFNSSYVIYGKTSTYIYIDITLSTSTITSSIGFIIQANIVNGGGLSVSGGDGIMIGMVSMM